MLTRCPHCETAFRVTTEQLKARHGQVRCGWCRELFDALDSLVDETIVVRHTESAAFPLPPAEETAPPPADEIGEPEPLAVDLLLETPEESEGSDEAEETRRSQGGGEPAGETKPAEPAAVEPPAEAEPPAETEIPAETETEVAEAVPAIPAAWETTAPPRRRWPWAIGAALLLVLAFVQSAYVFRTELAIRLPGSRPLLAAGCELAGCTLPRPRRPELVGIETSDLVPENGGLLLTATLKNQAPFDQEYPHLELTLTDTQDLALVGKVLSPADYLPAGQSPAAGFVARGEQAVRLRFEAPGVPAIGYRLYLFYP